MANNKQKEVDEMTVIECNKFMLENQINSDVTFIVGNDRKPIKAHKYVLGSRNSVFTAMLFGTLAENGEIIIPDIEPSVFCSLLDFFYTDQMEVTGNNVCALMYACNKYNAKGAMKKCIDFLRTSINSENVCQILENALLYNEVNLKEKCMSLIFRSASDILKSKQFTQLTKDSLKIIIESDNLVSR
ncbi:hypothetical protein KUTeg_017962 [Tegillarca granosa]|uniref:BTB domain-containing protein n=1 Tax=Tegillarca granosa TaxID=220873 RepID=A0ABQ9EHZ3_TEGGR|nr:hypothetical protein KUTeg_017962 [Tegillarca granosa]